MSVGSVPAKQSAPLGTGERTPSPVFDLFRRLGQALLVPVLAIFTALVISGLVIWSTTHDLALVIGPEGAFAGLWRGAVGTPANIAGTLQTSTPYIFAGLAVALAFKCGLFNIGAEGQLAFGAVGAAWIGYSLE